MRIIKLFLCLLLALSMSGCAPNARELIKQKKYDEAIKTLKERKDSYSKKEYKALMDECYYYKASQYYKKKSYEKAYDLLDGNSYKKASALMKQVKPKYQNHERCKKVMDAYHALAKEMEENYESEDREYSLTTGKNYYMNVGYNLNRVEESLKKNKMPDKELLLMVFDQVPKNVKQAKKWMKGLQKYFVWKLGIDELESMCVFLLTYNCKYTSGDVFKSVGHYYIDDVYNFTTKWHASPRVLGCAFLVFQDYGAEITSKNDRIVITWPYDTFGYYMCDSYGEKNVPDRVGPATVEDSLKVKPDGEAENGRVWARISFKLPPKSLKHVFVRITFSTSNFEEKIDEVTYILHNTQPNGTVVKRYKTKKMPTDTGVIYQKDVWTISKFTSKS